MNPGIPRRGRRAFAMALSIALATLLLPGCNEVQLFTDLPERDVNEMMAVLLQKGITATKLTGTEGKWTLAVPQESFAESVQLLKAMGYPKPSSEGLSETFRKSGLISSPSEERIRFMVALSHELEDTLAQLEGVVAARVHIVLPENDPLGDKLVPSRASIFIRHLEDADVESRVDEIKNMVVNSIEGLDREKVAVYLSRTTRQTVGSSPDLAVSRVGGRLVDAPAWLIAAACLLTALNVGTWIVLGFRRMGRRPPRTVAVTPVIDPGAVAIRSALPVEP